MLFGRNPKIKRPLHRKIINSFIYFGIGVIIAFMILFAISQTSTFRNWLREKVITTVNASINGSLSVEELDGTIFTSIILNNTRLVQARDTVFSADKIEIRTSPLKLLFKIIYFRKIEITNAKITLLKDKNGELNISRLIKPGEEEADTASSKFIFKFQTADLTLKNVDFTLQNYEKKGSKTVYDNMTLDDFRVKNINLSLDSFIDITKQDIRLNIHNLSGKPNLKGFKLNNLSGNFLVDRSNTSITGLIIETDRSNIVLNAAMKNFNVLNGNDRIETAPLKIDLAADKFNFDDLTNFVPSTSLLWGSVNTRISARGTLNNLFVRNIGIALDETRFNLSGKLKNITAGNGMLIDMKFSSVQINQSDVNDLLHTISLPVFKGYGLIEIDTLYFKGTPINFNAGLYARTDKGEFASVSSLDLTGKDIVYDIQFNSYGLDLNPVAGIYTYLNSSIKLKGTGFSPASLSSNLTFNADRSLINKRFYQSLKFSLGGAKGNIDFKLKFRSDTAKGNVTGTIDFENISKPVYSVKADIDDYNLADILSNPQWDSNLNLKLTADGESFDPDSINLFAVMSIDSSTFNKINLNNKKIIIDLRKNLKGQRVINLISNLADLTIMGDYSITDLSSMINTEANLISEFIENKIGNTFSQAAVSGETQNQYTLPDEGAHITYALEFKDFEMLSLFLNNADMEIDGEINGSVKRNADTLSASVELNVNYFRYWDGDKLYYVSDMLFGATLLNDFSKKVPDNLKSKIHLNAKHLFLNNKYNNLLLDADIENENIDLKFYGELDDYLTISLSGNINMADHSANMGLDTLYLRYNDYELKNKERINIAYINEEFHFNDFVLTHFPGEIILNGFFSLHGNQNLSLHINHIKGNAISTDIFGIPKQSRVKADINLAAFWQGTAGDPLLNMNLTVDSIQIRNRKIGAMITKVDYDSNVLSLGVNFLDTLYNLQNPKLAVAGTLPLNLSLESGDFITQDKPVDISFKADNFDLVTMENVVPYIKDIKGDLSAGIDIKGTFGNINMFGNADISRVSFTATLNNLKYETGAKILFDNENIEIDTLWIRNSANDKTGGTLYGWGNITYKNLELNDIEVYSKGKLRVLGNETRAVNPNIYGNLIIETRDDASYIKNNFKNEIDANLVVKRSSSVTFSPTRTAFSNQSDKFIYKYKNYSELSKNAIIDSLIILSNIHSRGEGIGPASSNPIDLNLKFEVEDDAKMVFILSPEFQQNLTVYLGGNFEYNLIDGKTIARGELNLLDGSKLEFIKPFQASGTVKFLNELDDPYLDITASFRDFYIPLDTVGIGGTEKEVEIRIRIEGPLSDLDKNFIQEEKNVSVYIRNNATSDFQLDPTKTPSDAIMFIIVGKFTDDATSQDRNIASSTAAAFAGSLVGSFLNQKLGDYVRGIRIQKVGSETKFSLIGKAGPVRYIIGGTSRVFQDISRANIKIEYPNILSLESLILRFERKEPLQGTSTYNEMINELGIRYRFDF